MKRKLNPRAVLEIEASSAEERSLYFTKKQRSKLSRRRRINFSPIIELIGPHSDLTTLSEVSCDSSIASVCNQNPPEFRNEFPGAITRSYYRKKFRNERKNLDQALELSDNSCVDTCSGVKEELKLKNRDVEELEIEGGVVTKSNVSSATSRLLSKIGLQKEKENESRICDQSVELSDISCTESCSGVNNRELKLMNKDVKESEIDGGEVTKSEASSARRCLFSENDVQEVKEHESSIEITQNEVSFGIPDVQKSFRGEITNSVAEIDNSLESGAESIWSDEKTIRIGENIAASDGLQLPEHVELDIDLACSEQFSSDVKVLGLEDEEDEESYRIMWKRERRQEYVRDYAEEYCLTTAYGDLVVQQRLHMVQWIVEEATKTELQKETMFLGVNLLDRFLSKGYFKNVRNLQIAGIACLTLATRIEENQPYNCIRKRTFNVGSTIYSRCEVVAMEWLVQEVLNFQCYLPTLHNFLWFYLKAARANEIMEKTAKYLAVLTLMAHQQLCYWPSTVAAGLVILASIATNQEISCHLITSIHANNKDTDLPECIKLGMVGEVPLNSDRWTFDVFMVHS
ncbi:hypothetical protein CASFOL_009919 [Castilleja foliolosa]|uniref:Cyclin-like domain-containing protein n=1 Tax=Castilleja foliolosa TaxID=1961234 RepID=A0ABD3DV19_9LAMI